MRRRPILQQIPIQGRPGRETVRRFLRLSEEIMERYLGPHTHGGSCYHTQDWKNDDGVRRSGIVWRRDGRPDVFYEIGQYEICVVQVVRKNSDEESSG